MTKVNTKCFMWEILARIDRGKFERFTFEENHVGRSAKYEKVYTD